MTHPGRPGVDLMHAALESLDVALVNVVEQNRCWIWQACIQAHKQAHIDTNPQAHTQTCIPLHLQGYVQTQETRQ